MLPEAVKTVCANLNAAPVQDSKVDILAENMLKKTMYVNNGDVFFFLLVFFSVRVHGHQRLPLCWHWVECFPFVKLQNGYVL